MNSCFQYWFDYIVRNGIFIPQQGGLIPVWTIIVNNNDYCESFYNRGQGYIRISVGLHEENGLHEEKVYWQGDFNIDRPDVRVRCFINFYSKINLQHIFLENEGL